MGSLVIDDVHVRTLVAVDEDEDDENREVTLSHGEWIWYSDALPFFRSSLTLTMGMICDCRDRKDGIVEQYDISLQKRVRSVLRFPILRPPITVLPACMDLADRIVGSSKKSTQDQRFVHTLSQKCKRQSLQSPLGSPTGPITFIATPFPIHPKYIIHLSHQYLTPDYRTTASINQRDTNLFIRSI